MDWTGDWARFTGCFLVFLESRQLVIFPFGELEPGPVSASPSVYHYDSTTLGKGFQLQRISINQNTFIDYLRVTTYIR